LIRQRVQQQTLRRHGHAGDPLYGIRRIARTRIQLLSTRQHDRLSAVLDAEKHFAVKVAYVIHQEIIAAYADASRRHSKRAMTRLIDSTRRGVPAGLEEIAQLGRTLWPAAMTTWRPKRTRIQKPRPQLPAVATAQRRTPLTPQCTANC
jgi:transposase